MLWLQKTTHLETCHLQTCHLQPYRCKHVLMIQKVKKFHLFKDIDDAAVSFHCRQSIVKILHSYMCINHCQISWLILAIEILYRLTRISDFIRHIDKIIV